MTEIIQSIPSRIKNAAVGGHVCGVEDIIDDPSGKTQQEINNDTYRKSETYNKTELNNMVTTPEVEYVNVEATDQTTDISDVLPATGAADTIYKIANWDGTQYDTSKYAEYSWNGTNYICLAVRDHGVDDEPTNGSNNFVKSGGVKSYVDSFNTTSKSPLYKKVEIDSNKRILSSVDNNNTRNEYLNARFHQNVDIEGNLNGTPVSNYIKEGDNRLPNYKTRAKNYIYALISSNKKLVAYSDSEGNFMWFKGIPDHLKRYFEPQRVAFPTNFHIKNCSEVLDKAIGVNCHIDRNGILYDTDYKEVIAYAMNLANFHNMRCGVYYYNLSNIKEITNCDNFLSSFILNNNEYNKNEVIFNIDFPDIAQITDADTIAKWKECLLRTVKHYNGKTIFSPESLKDTSTPHLKFKINYWELINEIDLRTTAENAYNILKIGYDTVKLIKEDNTEWESESIASNDNISKIVLAYGLGNTTTDTVTYSDVFPFNNKGKFVFVKASVYTVGSETPTEHVFVIPQRKNANVILVDPIYNDSADDVWTVTPIWTLQGTLHYKLRVTYDDGLKGYTKVSCPFGYRVRDFITSMREYGELTFFDYFDYHTYEYPTTIENDISTLYNTLKTVGIDNIPVWITETGYSTYNVSEENAGKYMPMQLITILAKGIEKVFIYNMRCSEISRMNSTAENTFGLIHNSLKATYFQLWNTDGTPLKNENAYRFFVSTNENDHHGCIELTKALVTNGIKVSTSTAVTVTRVDLYYNNAFHNVWEGSTPIDASTYLTLANSVFDGVPDSFTIFIFVTGESKDTSWNGDNTYIEPKPSFTSTKALTTLLTSGSTRPVIAKIDGNVTIAKWINKNNEPVFAIWSNFTKTISINVEENAKVYNYLGADITSGTNFNNMLLTVNEVCYIVGTNYVRFN